MDNLIFVFQEYVVRKKDKVVQKSGLFKCLVLVTVQQTFLEGVLS